MILGTPKFLGKEIGTPPTLHYSDRDHGPPFLVEFVALGLVSFHSDDAIRPLRRELLSELRFLEVEIELEPSSQM
ncbi:hypothetical protein A2U01_0055357, partial [Trifolium medium]|nr:hypothetical protein [Trifolium medium]